MTEDLARQRMNEQGFHRIQGVSWRWLVDELQGAADPGPEREVVFADTVNRLPPKARAVARFLIEYPDEFRAHVGLETRWEGCAKMKCCNCQILKRYLALQLGWSQVAVVRALRELRKKLLA